MGIFSYSSHFRNLAGKALAAATLLMLSLSATAATAPDPEPDPTPSNPYGIRDTLYHIYQRATHNRTTPLGLRTADTLYHEAAKMHDTKAMCLSRTIPLYHYFFKEEKAPLLKAVNELKAISEKYGEEGMYYNACNNYINFLIGTGEHYEAMEYARATREYAERHNSKVGVLRSILAMGYIHSERLENPLAIQNYKEAMTMAQKYGLTNELPNIYYRLCLSYCNTENYAESIKYGKLCVQNAVNASMKSYAESYLCIDYFHMGQYNKFEELYRHLVATANSGINNIAGTNLKYLTILYNIYKKNYSLALAMCDSIPYMKQNRLYRPMVYYYKGDYENTYRSMARYASLMDSARLMIANRDISMQEASIKRDLQRIERARIEFENSQLALARMQLDIENAQHIADVERINAENNELMLQNKELANKNMRATLRGKDIEQQRKEHEASNARQRLVTIVVSACIVLLFFSILLGARIRISKKLKQKAATLAVRNKELAVAQKRAEEDDHIKDIFLQNMSHEVRTPLNAIVGFSQIIAEDNGELSKKDKNDFSARIEDNSEIVMTIINDILDITSIESGHYKMQLAETQLNRTCRHSVTNHTDEIAEGVSIEFTSDFPDDYTINTDARRMGQVVHNLVSNAIKNTTEGSIHIHCAKAAHEGFVQITVTDTGCGIPAEHADRIYDRFYKIDDMKQGIGLGLSICHDIAEFLHGRLYLDQEHHPGARFVFEIPINSK